TDNNDNRSTSGKFTQTVNQASTTRAVTSSSNPSVFGQSVTLTATVSVTAPGPGAATAPTGTVTFKDGANTVGTGALAVVSGQFQATLTTTALTVGTHNQISAVYGGDTNFKTSTSANFIQTVNKASTSTAVTSSPNPSLSGQSMTFTATVSVTAPGSGTPAGTVNFQAGGTTIT